MQGCFYCTVTVSLMVSHTVRAQPVISADTLCVLIGNRGVLFGCMAGGCKDLTGWGITVTYISQSVGIVEGVIRTTSAQHRWRQLQRLIQHSALVLLSKHGSAVATSGRCVSACILIFIAECSILNTSMPTSIQPVAGRGADRPGGAA